ncbi:hypothetical protein CSPB12327_00050 [Campylobacter sp. RM12327]|uniref:Tetratricopeptide repeat protein n=1 Tax=Campylobacter sputorum subsp. sputorum TaxID=32024 RepID=A0A381DJ31_9BACT|nr:MULTISPECIES: hypothetical protein [Campylobacter]ASM35530.1 hypothetical protein CSPUT_1342 [Campylobacter sputorum aubsp. sputorum RM3237]ASM37245.1 hypothetical protein CSF_1396 [Campylobacter sputorum bv. faecalis CCUG 20703]ASM38910.1 hypothetical protein CSPARA_1366 [Campylobacter sputorum bv. paraureolyticus LMG 11764]ASM40481.1 hypothetical protein CSPB_1289 [Campylobacter sputorum]KAB0582736.1 hypothetical protein F7P64_00915 [Campylobacter sputorum subsp. sputorum]
MRNNTITEALIYESQGLKDDALLVYKNILKSDPHNKDATNAIRRISGLRKKYKDVNEYMLDFFVNLKTDEEINEFKRWLIKI